MEKTNHRTFFKKLKDNNKGLSLIEVLIVITITGFTLIALLNLARRDLLIEKLNEEEDVANFIAVSQLENFDNIKTLNSGCLSALQTNWNSNIKNYLVCSSNNYQAQYSSPALTPVAACNAAPNQSFYLYSLPANHASSYTYVNTSGNLYDCTTSAPAANSIYYSENLQVNNVAVNGTANVLTMQSTILRYALNKQFYTINLQEQYYF